MQRLGKRRSRDRIGIGAQWGLDQRGVEPLGIDHGFGRLREFGFGPKRRNLGFVRCLGITSRRRLRRSELRIARTGRRRLGLIERFNAPQTGCGCLRIADSFGILERQRER